MSSFRWVATALILASAGTLAFSQANGSDSADGVKATPKRQTAAGWRDHLAAGTPFFSDANALRNDISELGTFLSEQKDSLNAGDRKVLEESLERMRRYSSITQNSLQCSAQNEGAKTYLDRVLEGAKAQALALCAPGETTLPAQLARFKDIAETTLRSTPPASREETLDRLTTTARFRARQNLAQILAQLQAAQSDLDSFSQRLNEGLEPLSHELARLNRDINRELAIKKYGAEASEEAKKLFAARSSRYQALFADLVATPGLNVVLVEPILSEVGFLKTEQSLVVKRRESFNKTVVSFGEHPVSIERSKIESALKAAKEELSAALRRAEHDNETSLQELVLEYPVSVGESLMAARPEDLPAMMSRICEIVSQRAQKDRDLKSIDNQRDIALVALTFFGGGAIAKGATATGESIGAGRVLHGVLNGAARAGIAGDAMAANSAVVADLELKELLALHRRNPTLTQNTDALTDLAASVEEYRSARAEAIKSGVLTSIGALGALKSARLFASETDSASDIAKAAAKRVKEGPKPLDSFLGELSSCSIK